MLRVAGERDVTGAVGFRNAGEGRMDNKKRGGKWQVTNLDGKSPFNIFLCICL